MKQWTPLIMAMVGSAMVTYGVTKYVAGADMTIVAAIVVMAPECGALYGLGTVHANGTVTMRLPPGPQPEQELLEKIVQLPEDKKHGVPVPCPGARTNGVEISEAARGGTEVAHSRGHDGSRATVDGGPAQG